MDDPNFSTEPLSRTTALTVLTAMSRNLRNLLERKDAVCNWAAKALNPIQIAGRGDGTIMSTGVSITHSA